MFLKKDLLQILDTLRDDKSLRLRPTTNIVERFLNSLSTCVIHQWLWYLQSKEGIQYYFEPNMLTD